MLDEERQARVQELDGERMSGITFCSTDDLLAELFNRYEHCIFTGLKLIDTEKLSLKRKFKGNSDTCIGLAVKLQHFIVEDWNEGQLEGDIDE